METQNSYPSKSHILVTVTVQYTFYAKKLKKIYCLSKTSSIFWHLMSSKSCNYNGIPINKYLLAYTNVTVPVHDKELVNVLHITSTCQLLYNAVLCTRLKSTFLIKNHGCYRCNNRVKAHFFGYSCTWSYLQAGTWAIDFLVVCDRPQWFWYVHGMRYQTTALAMTRRIHTESKIFYVSI
jgi:hypothetical protein